MNEKYVKRPHQVKLISQERERRETHLARLRGPETGARRAQRGSQVSCESPDIVFFSLLLFLFLTQLFHITTALQASSQQ